MHKSTAFVVFVICIVCCFGTYWAGYSNGEANGIRLGVPASFEDLCKEYQK